MTKTIVITGATSGIGNLLVKEFAKQGCVVFAGYRNTAFKKDLQEIGENVIPFRIDLAKKWTVADAVKFINEKTDKIDTLVNAAGYVVAGAMECLPVDKIREQFEVNTFAQLQLAQGLFEKLEAGAGGKIINISSEASFGVFPFVAPYCASKRALDILFNSMQVECGGKCGSQSGQNASDSCKKGNIKVISIKPGVVKTPLWEKSIEGNSESLNGNEKYQKESEMLKRNAQLNAHRGLDAQEVVDLIVEVEKLKNPKPSYTIGADAKGAEILSHLPQGWINWIIKESIKQRCEKYK